jgi:hypothetical protein
MRNRTCEMAEALSQEHPLQPGLWSGSEALALGTDLKQPALKIIHGLIGLCERC